MLINQLPYFIIYKITENSFLSITTSFINRHLEENYLFLIDVISTICDNLEIIVNKNIAILTDETNEDIEIIDRLNIKLTRQRQELSDDLESKREIKDSIIAEINTAVSESGVIMLIDQLPISVLHEITENSFLSITDSFINRNSEENYMFLIDAINSIYDNYEIIVNKKIVVLTDEIDGNTNRINQLRIVLTIQTNELLDDLESKKTIKDSITEEINNAVLEPGEPSDGFTLILLNGNQVVL